MWEWKQIQLQLDTFSILSVKYKLIILVYQSFTAISKQQLIKWIRISEYFWRIFGKQNFGGEFG